MAWITGHRDDQPRIQQGPSDPERRHARGVRAHRRSRRARGDRCRAACSRSPWSKARSTPPPSWCSRRPPTATCSNATATAARTSRRRACTADASDETWLAVSVATDDAVGRRWSTCSGDPEWATDPELATYAGRRARHDELDAHLGEWSAEQRRRRRGRAARRPRGARPRSGATRARCTTTRSCRPGASTRTIDHPVVGHDGDARRWPFRFASVDRWLRTPAPTLGQHNHEILVDDLGVDEATCTRR